MPSKETKHCPISRMRKNVQGSILKLSTTLFECSDPVLHSLVLRRQQQSCTVWVPCINRIVPAVAGARQYISAVILSHFAVSGLRIEKVNTPYIQSQAYSPIILNLSTSLLHCYNTVIFSAVLCDNNNSPRLRGEYRPPSSSSKPRPKYIQRIICESRKGSKLSEKL